MCPGLPARQIMEQNPFNTSSAVFSLPWPLSFYRKSQCDLQHQTQQTSLTKIQNLGETCKVLPVDRHASLKILVLGRFSSYSCLCRRVSIVTNQHRNRSVFVKLMGKAFGKAVRPYVGIWAVLPVNCCLVRSKMMFPSQHTSLLLCENLSEGCLES